MAEQQKTFSMVLSERVADLGEALPKQFNQSRFVNNLMALINDNTDLQKYSQREILAGACKGAVLGLDFLNKEAYLVPYGGHLQFQIDYRGAKKLAKRYAIRPVKDIYAKIVRQGDEFSYSIVDGKQVVNYNPKPFNDGAIVGAFAVCEYVDGGMEVDTMSLKELENTRSSSRAKNSPAWNKFTSEMYKKTVLHRLCKHIEIDFENPTQRDYFDKDMEVEVEEEQHEVVDIFDEAEVIDVVD